MTDIDALTTLGSYAELWRRVQAAVLRWETGPAVTTLGSESEPSVVEKDFGSVATGVRASAPLTAKPPSLPAEAPEEPATCDSCGAAAEPGTLGPDPDPECAGLWCGECVVAGERFREGKEVS